MVGACCVEVPYLFRDDYNSRKVEVILVSFIRHWARLSTRIFVQSDNTYHGWP